MWKDKERWREIVLMSPNWHRDREEEEVKARKGCDQQRNQ